ncbi:DinB family protein [Alteromonas oceanisediminis]|uniref:DinB family protein n=1 Tax=Alteromonas oceanisediminis TaxID=2836180 RepID=UPI001BD9EECD|nr:DinB family protein [Alteromonas oceanisediminis]
MLQSHIEVLQQAIDLLNDVSTDDFQRVMHPHLSGSIGKHLRHVIDHFLAIENGLLTGVIDYNQRNRNANIEVSISATVDTLEAIQRWLRALEPTDLAGKFEVRSEISLSDTVNATCESTLAREIVFASSHAIHHFSLISIIRSLQGQPVPDYFGFAPATLTHLSEHV